MATRIISLRLSEEDIQKLDELVSLSQFDSRSSFIGSAVRLEYDRISGNPQLRSLVDQLQSLRVQIESLRVSEGL